MSVKFKSIKSTVYDPNINEKFNPSLKKSNHDSVQGELQSELMETVPS